jgi:lipopolysaccharide export system protein LptC
MIFIAGAAISAGCFVGPIIGQIIYSDSGVRAGPVKGVTMLNPRFNGRDSSGNVYTLIAATARRRLDEMSVVDLDQPQLEDGSGGYVRAASGVFDQANQVLTLEGDVYMENSFGYNFQTQSATVYLTEGRVVGPTPIIGYGPVGEMRGDQFEIINSGERATLTGGVWTRINDPDAEPDQTNDVSRAKSLLKRSSE